MSRGAEAIAPDNTPELYIEQEILLDQPPQQSEVYTHVHSDGRVETGDAARAHEICTAFKDTPVEHVEMILRVRQIGAERKAQQDGHTQKPAAEPPKPHPATKATPEKIKPTAQHDKTPVPAARDLAPNIPDTIIQPLASVEPAIPKPDAPIHITETAEHTTRPDSLNVHTNAGPALRLQQDVVNHWNIREKVLAPEDTILLTDYSSPTLQEISETVTDIKQPLVTLEHFDALNAETDSAPAADTAEATADGVPDQIALDNLEDTPDIPVDSLGLEAGTIEPAEPDIIYEVPAATLVVYERLIAIDAGRTPAPAELPHDEIIELHATEITPITNRETVLAEIAEIKPSTAVMLETIRSHAEAAAPFLRVVAEVTSLAEAPDDPEVTKVRRLVHELEALLITAPVAEEDSQPELTPAITDRLLALMRALGYNQPEEVMAEFVANYGIAGLLQALQYLCDIDIEGATYERSQLAAASASPQGDGALARLQRLGSLLLHAALQYVHSPGLAPSVS